MARDPRYDILFEPIKMLFLSADPQPVLQMVPQSATGWAGCINSMIAMRGMKAAGGWGALTIETVSDHRSTGETALLL